jgi:pimeloyl-ACP methyl ester carboxylesterase
MMSPIIFVHGAGLDAGYWQLQTEFFAESLAIDLPGHGTSKEEAVDNVTAYAEWLGKKIRSIDTGPVTLVGHSMGSLVVLETAARNPDFVDHLVLIATSATMPVHRGLVAAAEERDPEAAAMVMKWSVSTDPGFGRPKPWVDEIADLFVSAAKSGVLAQDFTACDSYVDAVAMAGRVQCPTLLLLGERDLMTKPTAAQPLAAALSNARIVVVEGGGHMLPLENAADVNDAITLFLTTD